MSLRHRLCLPSVGAFGLAFVFGVGSTACGPKAPGHNGYKAKRKAPWKKAKAVTLDESGELEIDGKVSWNKRRRARWYVLDIPSFGELELKVRSRQIGGKDDGDEFDLAFEILNEDSGRVLVRADMEEDDSGEEERSRRLSELDPGPYLIHVYLQNRMHAASFNIRLKFVAMEVEQESDFPKQVAFVGNMPAVPPIDDAPPPVRKPKPCRGKNCRKKPPKNDDPKPTSIGARITSIRNSGSRTVIRIGAGTNRGVTKGARGRVVTRSGVGIPKGGFTVNRVTATESWASVKASQDAVNAAQRVRITPK